MIHVFPSLEHSTDCGCKPADNFRTFVCVPYGCRRTKHNRAKPMSELLSALISIADSSEFRFARFNIVYARQCVQTWKRHGISCKALAGRNTRIFSRRMLQLLFSRNLACCASCNIVYPRRTVYASCEDHYLLPIFQTGFL